MSLPRLFGIFCAILFGAIVMISLFKGGSNHSKSPTITVVDSGPIEIEIDLSQDFQEPEEIVHASAPKTAKPIAQAISPYSDDTLITRRQEQTTPEVNRIDEFFNKGMQKFPIVKTIRYTSRVGWQKGRPAWLADYASHYKTSRHFIARSLNGKKNYLKQDVAEGDRFNVLDPDKNIEFHLVVDTQCCKMLFYYVDADTNERMLVKSYDVGLGRIDESRESGLLTPLGKYTLGEKVAVYKPGKKGYFNGDRIEMIGIFGTRWIPFDQELSGCTEPAKGFGIHGLPRLPDENGTLKEAIGSLGQYGSDGCIRLATDDMEELFSIIITRPTTIEIVQNFRDAPLPGLERE